MQDLWLPDSYQHSTTPGGVVDLDDVADEPELGRVAKVVAFSPDGAPLVPVPYDSKQIREDPFASLGGQGAALLVPPYDFSQLVSLAESEPVHAACLEQKTSDVIGTGPRLVLRGALDNDASGTSDGDPNEPTTDGGSGEEHADIMQWWEDLSDETTSLELLLAATADEHTLGWGALELARDLDGVIRRVYYVPAHTIRAHPSGRLFCQHLNGKFVWFKKWREQDEFYASSGRRVSNPADIRRLRAQGKLANELLIFRRPTRRSYWYGVPTYISGLGHIILSLFARDYNVLFFNNAREPRYVFVVTGLSGAAVNKTIAVLSEHLKSQHKEPHRNLLVPLTGGAEMKIERMTLQQNDMHWVKLTEKVNEEILIAHRMPPDRLGVPHRGFLGGSVARVINTIYKQGVIQPSQSAIADRLDRFFRIEYSRARGHDEKNWAWRVMFPPVDIGDTQLSTEIIIDQVRANFMTLNEARSQLGKRPLDIFGKKTLAEYLSQFGVKPNVGDLLYKSSTLQPVPTSDLEERLISRVESLLEEALTTNREDPELVSMMKE